MGATSGGLNEKEYLSLLDNENFKLALSEVFRKINGSDLPTVEDKNAQQLKCLQDLILLLVQKIGISRFQGKYEDKLEIALEELMRFSSLQKGLKLAPDLLRDCLGIISRYYLEKNRVAFFSRRNPDTDFTMRAYLRVTLANLNGIENLAPFATQADIEVFLAASQDDKMRMVGEGEFSPTIALRQLWKNNLHCNNAQLAKMLITQWGANIMWRPFSPTDNCFLDYAIYGLLHDKEQPAMWNLCVELFFEKKISDKLLVYVMMALLVREEEEEFLGATQKAIQDLLKHGVKITEDFFDVLNQVKNAPVKNMIDAILKDHRNQLQLEQQQLEEKIARREGNNNNTNAVVLSGKGKADGEDRARFQVSLDALNQITSRNSAPRSNTNQDTTEVQARQETQEKTRRKGF